MTRRTLERWVPSTASAQPFRFSVPAVCRLPLARCPRNPPAQKPARPRRRSVLIEPPACVSFHRRNHKLGAFLGAGRPTRGHGLGLGVEADRIRPMLIEVAETGPLPAAECMICKRNRDREIDAHHTNLDA